MLSETQLVGIRNAIERTYTDKMNVYGYFDEKNNDIFDDVTEDIVISEEPCRVSFNSDLAAKPTYENDGAAKVEQKIKLFCAPEVMIQPGSKIEVTRGNRIMLFTRSGEPAVYATHQEIVLESVKVWA